MSKLDTCSTLSAWVDDDSSVLCWENEVGYSVVELGFVWCMGDLRKVGLCGVWVTYVRLVCVVYG